MHLDPLYLFALPKLSHTGSSEHVQGILDLTSIDIGHRHFDVPEGIAYDANLVNTGEAILLSGTASARLDTSCDRCLNPTSLDITGEIQGYYLFDKKSVEDGESLEVYEEVDADGRIDIAPPILAAIVVELPVVTVCGHDCVGFAPVKPEAECDETAPADDVNPESPFAALKDYKFEE